MMTYDNFELYEYLEDLVDLPPIRNIPADQVRNKPHISTCQNKPNLLAEFDEGENDFAFSYHASKHEKAWLTDSLQDFYHQHWFDDVLQLIKGGGKEASVYQCLANETTGKDYLAAKVYRPRKFRQLRNDALYREGRSHLDDEGRVIKNGGALHAIQKRTTIGLRLMHTSWIEHEFQTMSLLFNAGADVPEPFVSDNNAILMAYIGWDDLPAPTLNTVDLPRRQAKRIFDQVLHNVAIMLANQRVHGDLSAFNVLYFEGEIYLIDFPQAIDPQVNRNAYAIFRRDMLRLCEYFQAQGIKCNPAQLAEDLWTKHGYPLTPALDPRLVAPDFSTDD